MNTTVTIANLLLSVFGLYLCICRMAKMDGSTTKTTVRWQYAIYFGALTASAIGWTDAGTPQWPQLVMTLAIVVNLSLGFGAWKDGLPDYVMKDGHA